MRASYIVLLSTILFGASQAMADSPPLGVGGSLGFPTPVQMFGGGDPDPNRTQDVGAEFQFSNLTNGTVILKANSDCESKAWAVTNAAGTEVERSAACPAGGQPVTLNVEPGKPVNGDGTVTLHVFDYKEGQTYTIHYTAFGVTMTGDFTVSLLK